MRSRIGTMSIRAPAVCFDNLPSHYLSPQHMLTEALGCPWCVHSASSGAKRVATPASISRKSRSFQWRGRT